MSQASLDDDELFADAASEMRADVEEALEEARDALPEPEEFFEVDADNVVGALNGLKGGLDAGDAVEHLRDAKKWFTMGQRADAFDDADDLEADIAELEDLITDVETANEQVTDLAATVPSLRERLDD
ncbi:hypothetical protein BRD18_01750 [Halobacteriales archaeon SW_7_71_33]|nr:MAG: hypothetical protein BRD18_01750 [Halobacteriales archaeon SW_7_71_33]